MSTFSSFAGMATCLPFPRRWKGWGMTTFTLASESRKKKERSQVECRVVGGEAWVTWVKVAQAHTHGL